ncbi:hypothetical protein BGZ73_000662, partial [Actinomortierella ambigua]
MVPTGCTENKGDQEVDALIPKYEAHPDVLEASRRFAEQDVATQSAKPVDLAASWRVYVDGQETPLTATQNREKQQLEANLVRRVHELKGRMAEASRSRRKAIKAKKAQGGHSGSKTVSGPSAPSAPTGPAAPLGTGDAARRQSNHWAAVEHRREERPLAVTARADACKAEHHSQGFDRFPSKQYTVKVHTVQDRPPFNDGFNLELPDDVELKPFRPYTTLDSVKEQKKKATKAATSGAGPLSKAHVVMGITGHYQVTTLNVGQLGRNVGHAISANALPSNVMSPAERQLLAEEAKKATVRTVRRVVRVSNDLLRHGQKCMVLYITTKSDAELAPLKNAIFNKGRFAT